MFSSMEDDEIDFQSTGGGSKLRSIFGTEQSAVRSSNESLTYHAPKQPKKKESSPAPSSQTTAGAPEILNATAAHAYKYVNGQYASQGKMGVAILGTHGAQDYKILLYLSKQQQVTSASISTAFNFTIQPNNYASFYDDSRQNWSLLFDSEQNLLTFAKQIVLAKALSMGSGLDTVVSLDLAAGEGGVLETGDSAEVRYTGWLLTNNKYGQVFDSNASSDKAFRLKLGKGKVIKGWDSGMLGMKKGGKRILIIPAHLAYGSQGAGDKIPANSTLIFEIEVLRVKLSKADSPAVSPGPVVSPAPPPSHHPPPPPGPSPDEEQSVKTRTKSLTEQMAQPNKSDKAKLISRMARMGQPMLPMAGPVPAGPESDEDEELLDHQQAMVTEQQLHQPVHATHLIQAHHTITHPIAQPVHAKPRIASKPALPSQVPQSFQPLHTQPAPSAMPAVDPMVQNVATMGVGMTIGPQGQPVMVGQPMFHPAQQQQQQQMMMAQQAQQQQPVPAFVQALQPQSQISLYQPALPQQQAQPFQMQQPSPFVQPQPLPQPPPPQPPAAPSATSELTPILLSESRQQNTEVRINLSKVSDKIDKVLEKVENLQTHGLGLASNALSIQNNTPAMESSVLMYNIQRVIQENERLKKDIFEKSAKVETQNEKIADLLQRNQKYVEDSNMMLEQRNDSFKATSSQSQVRVLTLEQEKVKLVTDLGLTTASLSTLQQDLDKLRQTEIELKQQLVKAMETAGSSTEELNTLKIHYSDGEKRLGELEESWKKEKSTRKELQTTLSSLQEELTDVKTERQSLEKNLTERKKKQQDERRKIEEEYEENKVQYEQEIQSLRERLRKQKSSTDSVTADKYAELEAELAQEWKEKCEKLVHASDEKHRRAVQDLQEEREQLEQRNNGLEAKLQTLRSGTSNVDQKVLTLQDQIAELIVWKDKYDNLRNQASAMRDRYEDKIQLLDSEHSESAEKSEQLQVQVAEQQNQLTRMRQAYQELQRQREEEMNVRTAAAAAELPAAKQVSSERSSEESRELVVNEVKKIMNSVFQSVRKAFVTTKNYKGSEVISSMLQIIKSTTLKLAQGETTLSSAQQTKDESDDEEEEVDEEEEEEDADDEADNDDENEEKKEERNEDIVVKNEYHESKRSDNLDRSSKLVVDNVVHKDMMLSSSTIESDTESDDVSESKDGVSDNVGDKIKDDRMADDVIETKVSGEMKDDEGSEKVTFPEEIKADNELDNYVEKGETIVNKTEELLTNQNNTIAQEDNVIAQEDNVIAQEDNVIAQEDNVIAQEDNVIEHEDDDKLVLESIDESSYNAVKSSRDTEPVLDESPSSPQEESVPDMNSQEAGDKDTHMQTEVVLEAILDMSLSKSQDRHVLEEKDDDNVEDISDDKEAITVIVDKVESDIEILPSSADVVNESVVQESDDDENDDEFHEVGEAMEKEVREQEDSLTNHKLPVSTDGDIAAEVVDDNDVVNTHPEVIHDHVNNDVNEDVESHSLSNGHPDIVPEENISQSKVNDKPSPAGHTDKETSVLSYNNKPTTGDTDDPNYLFVFLEAKKDDEINPQVIGSMPSMEPPPLDMDSPEVKQNNTMKSLFGDDEDDDVMADMFGPNVTPVKTPDSKEQEKAENVRSRSNTSGSEKKVSKLELTNEDFKAAPPPLFGDDDDDDLDWLS